jgi:DNA repair protein RadC
MRTPLPAWCRIIREASAVYQEGAQIRDAADVFRLLKDRAQAEEIEVFYVLALNGKHKVSALQEVSRGSATAALVHPREVFRLAIALGAAAVILAHNHPSGDPAPSAEDTALTSRLRQAGELLGIRVLDHVVIGTGDRFVSLAETK